MNIPPDRSKSTGNSPNWSRINQWLLWLGLAAAVAWMFYRHNAHLLQLLPFLFILACPLIHIFGHGSHGAHGGHDHQDQPPRGDEEGSPARQSDDRSRPKSVGQSGHHH
ncbi:TPA: DUF2933 domain-containing protein [Pseudomonas aeruginosa]|jgi:hypothetical protein|uniref:DUF2933 domain-containing protein n=4 Tax=Pseudomonadota TaxID=1224 RepID=A0A426V6N8_9BURK|nr:MULTISPECIES: DUF2933 domain-containing protein [Pseudomonadota]ALY92249.1 hypothetical protein HW02_24635 [Pseudomonas aeruginosa]ALY94457.1 hypothetical protein HW01_03670 [Pseudomonas aeruginosa]ALZ19638.1 hypothetical protein HV97_13335 [Pseudomonas aeruginosa]ALZ39661.1 hypothetical protein HW11_25615 [Pseudomonas aeruginosa]AYW72502.1 DUF2933 domain-containing protein [Pseudomonas aeruginosa]